MIEKKNGPRNVSEGMQNESKTKNKMKTNNKITGLLINLSNEIFARDRNKVKTFVFFSGEQRRRGGGEKKINDKTIQHSFQNEFCHENFVSNEFVNEN